MAPPFILRYIFKSLNEGGDSMENITISLKDLEKEELKIITDQERIALLELRLNFLEEKFKEVLMELCIQKKHEIEFKEEIINILNQVNEES